MTDETDLPDDVDDEDERTAEQVRADDWAATRRRYTQLPGRRGS